MVSDAVANVEASFGRVREGIDEELRRQIDIIRGELDSVIAEKRAGEQSVETTRQRMNVIGSELVVIKRKLVDFVDEVEYRMNGTNNQGGAPNSRTGGDSVIEDVWSERITALHKLEGRRCELQDRIGVDKSRGGSTSRSAGFRVAIIGAPKTGKTCILNSLIGLPILPMPVVPVSSGPIWLKWGEEKRATLRNAAGAVSDVEFADLESLAETDSLELQWPLALCKDGVEFVEVPAYPREDGTPRQELETADLVLFVLSCRALASKADLALIESAAQLGLTEILFVCNHSDGISPEDMKGLELRSAALLKPRTTVPGQAVFFVSGMWALEAAEGQDLGLVQRSGIDALRCAIADYIGANQNRAKAIKLVATARLELDAIRRALEQAGRRCGRSAG